MIEVFLFFFMCYIYIYIMMLKELVFLFFIGCAVNNRIIEYGEFIEEILYINRFDI